MVALSLPMLSLPYGKYIILWAVVGILGFGVILGLTLPVYRRLHLPES